MDNFEERTVAGLTVRIDRLICVGFETCVDETPEVFAMDAEGIATFVDAATQAERDRLLEACRSCPVDAISVHDGHGTQLVP